MLDRANVDNLKVWFAHEINQTELGIRNLQLRPPKTLERKLMTDLMIAKHVRKIFHLRNMLVHVDGLYEFCN